MNQIKPEKTNLTESFFIISMLVLAFFINSLFEEINNLSSIIQDLQVSISSLEDTTKLHVNCELEKGIACEELEKQIRLYEQFENEDFFK